MQLSTQPDPSDFKKFEHLVQIVADEHSKHLSIAAVQFRHIFRD